MFKFVREKKNWGVCAKIESMALLLAEINRDGPAPVPISGMLQKRTKVLKAWQGRYFTVRSHFLLVRATRARSALSRAWSC